MLSTSVYFWFWSDLNIGKLLILYIKILDFLCTMNDTVTVSRSYLNACNINESDDYMFAIPVSLKLLIMPNICM